MFICVQNNFAIDRLADYNLYFQLMGQLSGLCAHCTAYASSDTTAIDICKYILFDVQLTLTSRTSTMCINWPMDWRLNLCNTVNITVKFETCWQDSIHGV